MNTKLEHLDREAALMMYVAGELSPTERQSFEQRLAADATLAADLQRLQESDVACTAALSRADASQRMPVTEAVAVRRVVRAMHQWRVERVARPAPTKAKGLPLPWWCYAGAVAASLLVGGLVWTSNRPVGPLNADPSIARQQNAASAEDDELADWLGESLADAKSDDTIAEQILASEPDDLNGVLFNPSEETSW
jgi:anti-sigma factor RsiW